MRETLLKLDTKGRQQPKDGNMAEREEKKRRGRHISKVFI